MKANKTLQKFVSVCLLLLLGLDLFVNFTPQVKAVSSVGIRQGILILTTSSLSGFTVYNYPKVYAQLMGLPYQVVETDNTDITNSTFYDANGNGKWALIFLVYSSANNINSTEKSYLDSYEQALNVTEASLYAQSFPTSWLSRYGIQSKGSNIKIYNMTLQKNNVRLEFERADTGSNFTTITDVTVFNNVTHYIKGGNETQTYPVLWSYRDANGVVRTASSHLDASPLWVKFWAWMPYTLALRLSSVNLLLHNFVTYDIHDMNMEGYGENMHQTEAQNLKNFYDTYGMPFNLVTNVQTAFGNESHWYSEYNDFWNYVVNNPEPFDIVLHQNPNANYTDLPARWKFLSSQTDQFKTMLLNEVPVSYLYHVGGAWFINGTTAQQHYQYGVRFQSQDEGTYSPSQYYPDYTNVWISSAYGFGSDNNTWASLLSETSYVDTRERFNYFYIDTMHKAMQKIGGYLIFHTHYPAFANEQPILDAIEDLFFASEIYPTKGARAVQISFMSRTIGQNGSYTINNPIYYPSNNTFMFSLTQDKDTPPDNIAGIIVADPTASMSDAIMTQKEKQATFFLFKYQAGKTYTIDLSQTPTPPYIKQTQAWLSTTSYSNNKLTFTVSAPSGVSSTTKIYTGTKGKPRFISGATSYSYNSATKILTLTVKHSSSQQVEVSWWARPVRSIWLNFLPLAFILGVTLAFAVNVKKTGKINLNDIIMVSVAFILAVILSSIALNIFYGT